MKSLFSILLPLLLCTALAAQTLPAEEPASGLRADRDFVLELLLSPGTAEIDAAVTALNGAPATQRSLPESPEQAYALGILYQYRHLRTGGREDAFHSLALLQRSGGVHGTELWHALHLGMAHAAAAKFKRARGLRDMRAMWAAFDSIPEEHPDWLVRFLRGVTLTELGLALPRVIFLAEEKRRALETGRRQLQFVLQQNGRPEAAVPPAVAERSLALLYRSE